MKISYNEHSHTQGVDFAKLRHKYNFLINLNAERERERERDKVTG